MRSDVAIVLLAHRDCSLLTSAGDESCIPKRNDLAVGFAVSRGCVMLAPAVAPGSNRTSGLSVEVVFLAMCVTHCTHMTATMRVLGAAWSGVRLWSVLISRVVLLTVRV